MQFTQSTCVCPVHCPPEGLQERQQALAASFAAPVAVRKPFPDDVRFGLLEIPAPSSFQPKTGRDGLPSLIDTKFNGMCAELAPVLNATQWSRKSGRWAVVTWNGHLRIVSMSMADRPAALNALPIDCEPHGDSKDLAVEEMVRRNTARLETAIVPKTWTVVVRNLRYRPDGTPATPIEDEILDAIRESGLAVA